VSIYTSANKTNPLVPSLLAAPLIGNEFVLFSLPYKVMMKGKGRYRSDGNRGVTIFVSDKAVSEKSGYLSHETSYRSIVLGNRLGSTIAIWHILRHVLVILTLK
jgi:hypothetical protein